MENNSKQEREINPLLAMIGIVFMLPFPALIFLWIQGMNFSSIGGGAMVIISSLLFAMGVIMEKRAFELY